MAAPILIQTVEARITLLVGEELVEQQLGYLPWLLGENLAGLVDPWVMEQGMGYYPALDYLRQQPEVVDPALLTLIDQVAFFCTDYSERELLRRLKRQFSRVSISHSQCLAYTMPRIRLSRGGAPGELARHYAPNRLRLTLQLSSLQKAEFDGIEQLSLEKLQRWGRSAFAEFQIEGSRLLTPVSKTE